MVPGFHQILKEVCGFKAAHFAEAETETQKGVMSSSPLPTTVGVCQQTLVGHVSEVMGVGSGPRSISNYVLFWGQEDSREPGKL